MEVHPKPIDVSVGSSGVDLNPIDIHTSAGCSSPGASSISGIFVVPQCTCIAVFIHQSIQQRSMEGIRNYCNLKVVGLIANS